MSTIYAIIEASEVDQVDFAEVKETSADTLRFSLDETKTVVKFEGETPSFLDGKTQYNHQQILAVLAGTDWTPPIPPE